LTSALDGGECSISRPGRFTPRERAPGSRWIGVWVGPKAGLDTPMRRSPVVRSYRSVLLQLSAVLICAGIHSGPLRPSLLRCTNGNRVNGMFYVCKLSQISVTSQGNSHLTDSGAIVF